MGWRQVDHVRSIERRDATGTWGALRLFATVVAPELTARRFPRGGHTAGTRLALLKLRPRPQLGPSLTVIMTDRQPRSPNPRSPNSRDHGKHPSSSFAADSLPPRSRSSPAQQWPRWRPESPRSALPSPLSSRPPHRCRTRTAHRPLKGPPRRSTRPLAHKLCFHRTIRRRTTQAQP